MKRDRSGVVEALVFTAATLVYIWALRPDAAWTVWILVAWSAVTLARTSKLPDEAGLSPLGFAQTIFAWRYAVLAGLLALSLVLRERLAEPELLLRGAAYFVWCCIQQTVYQNVVYRRMKNSFGAGVQAWLLSGLMFALAHLPNPVLVPATAAWGVASSYLFEKWPSIPALALVQVTLSSLLYELTPLSWHHGFRVGPGYFRG